MPSARLRPLRPLDSVHSLRPLGGDDPRRWPWLLLAAPVLAAGAWLLWMHLSAPRSLDDVTLVGDRSPACHRLVVASDQSGSMDDYIPAREQALSRFAAWAPHNLRGNDELAVVTFSGHTTVTTAPTEIADNPHPTTSGHTSSDGTLLTPVLDTVAALPDHGCITSLILLSDGMFGDLSADSTSARDQMHAAGIDHLFLILPHPDIAVPDQWNQLYPYAAATAFDGTDPDTTGLAFGRITSTLTGQKLEKIDR